MIFIVFKKKLPSETEAGEANNLLIQCYGVYSLRPR